MLTMSESHPLKNDINSSTLNEFESYIKRARGKVSCKWCTFGFSTDSKLGEVIGYIEPYIEG